MWGTRRFHAGNGLTSLLGHPPLAYCLVERLKAPVLPSAMGAIVVCSLLNFFIADRWVYTARVKPLNAVAGDLTNTSVYR